jgi:hypothetical protein
MDPISTTLTISVLKQVITHLTKKILETNWDKSIESAKELIRQLSEDYASEVYAEKYVSKFMKMRTLHSAEADVYLDEIYTPLTLTVQSNDDQVVIEDKTTLHFSRVINIIGLAGQGKSTILRKLFLEEMRIGNRFPFIIELRKIEESTIINYFKDILKNIGLVYQDGDPELLLQSKKMILMLDGFDEIATKNRQRMLNEIINIKTRYNCDIIVTTRPDTEICTEVDITNLRVNPLKENDIISILAKLDTHNELSELPKIISANENLKNTLISPILVNLLFVCYPYLDIVPESVTDFYDKLFITLYSRHDKIKNFNREKYSSLSSVVANDVFNGLCFYSLNRSIFDFNEKTLHEFIVKSLKYYSIDLSITEQLQKDFINITCLIQRDGFDKYVFLHKSIQEFHAAKFIASLTYDNKIKFYDSTINNIDHSDTFDNFLNFLSKIDKNDFDLLLTIGYFNKCGLINIKNGSDSTIDVIISKILDESTCQLKIQDDHIECVGLSSFWKNGLFSTLSFLENGVRDKNSEKNDLTGKFLSLFFPEFIKEQRHTNLTAENIIKNSIRKINDDNGGGIYILKIKDYLHLVEFTEKCHELLKDRISSFYNNTYKPLNENLKQATNIFNMEFD